MKKVFNFIIIFLVTMSLIGITSEVKASSSEPEYDGTFNGNKGIFYANGNPITIDINTGGETVVNWKNGSQVVPQTVTIIGGGNAGTTVEQSNITMNNGIVSLIYGGGMSLDENNISTVNKSQIKINGGTIKSTIYAGGLMYTTTNESKTTVDEGTISAICGGGCASAVISGIPYSAGNASDMENSKNRTEQTKITVNGGTIDTVPTNYGAIFGGGQGYSYVGNSELEINGGNLSKAYITAGGSNGYTDKANVKITGGIIKIYQGVNRGKINEVEFKMTGGIINQLYLGGETEDASVTGIINKSESNIIGGEVQHLRKGKSNGTELVVDQNKYKIVDVDGTVSNSEIGSSEIKITTNFNIKKESINVFKGDKKIIEYTITTVPSGYENLYNDEKITWTSNDENIATIDNSGKVKGIKKGSTIIKGNLLQNEDEIIINVTSSPTTIFITILVGIVGIIILAILIFGLFV